MLAKGQVSRWDAAACIPQQQGGQAHGGYELERRPGVLVGHEDAIGYQQGQRKQGQPRLHPEQREQHGNCDSAGQEQAPFAQAIDGPQGKGPQGPEPGLGIGPAQVDGGQVPG